MATFTDNKTQVEQEFKQLKSYFDEMKKLIHKPNEFNTISMGMSNDYDIAIKNGSNMIRVGSSLFGARH